MVLSRTWREHQGAASDSLQGALRLKATKGSWYQEGGCSHSPSMTSLGLSSATHRQRVWGALFPHQPRRTQEGL